MNQLSQSDSLTVWAHRLAHRVAPDESDIAADLAFAYAAGGVQRQELFVPVRTDPGPAGDGVGRFLPHLWHALDDAYPVLRAVLSDPVVGNVAAIAELVLAQRRTREDVARPTTPAARWTNSAVDQLRDGLEPTGLSHAEAEQAAIDIVEEMLADPASAADFLDRLRARS